MAKTKISEYSSTANSNTDIASINIDEGCAPSGINNAIRALMAQLKNFQTGADGDSFNGPVNGTIGATTPAAGTFTSLSDSGNLTFTGTGNRITGDFSNSTQANKVMFQSSTTNANTNVGLLPNGTAVQTVFQLHNNADPTNAGIGQLITNTTDISFRSAITGTGSYLPMTFYTGGSERMRVDTSGNVGIGTSSPSKKFVVSNAGANGIEVSPDDATTSTNRILSYNRSTAAYTPFVIQGSDLRLYTTGTGATESMRIDSSGNLLVGTTSSQTNVNGITTVGANSNSYQCVAQNTSGTAGSAVYKAQLSNASATTASYFFFYATNGAGSTYSLRADGSSTFSSDQTLKKNIVDSRGYLDDLMKLRPVKYHWKTQDDNDPEKWLGLIAQEVEQVFPNLVCEDKAEEGETPTKAVKYSVLPMMMLKAIQEQQTLIQDQLALINSLTARIEALEQA